MEDLFSGNYGNDSIEKIGIEIEYLLLDEKDLDLADSIGPLMQKIGEDPCIGEEVFQACVELKSEPLANTSEIKTQISEKLQELRPHLDALDLRLCSLGVHPFSQKISKTTEKKRYLDLEKNHPYLTRNQMDFSNHVHVSMDSLEQSLEVMRSLRYLLPVFMAVSASGPFWKGERTGFVSFRQFILKGNVHGGIPPHFKDKEDFIRFYEGAKNAGAVKCFKDIHWDIKPRPDLGTLELRVMDAVPSLDEAMAITALAHCTIRALKTKSLCELLPNIFSELPPQWSEAMNYFQASHLGADARIVVDSHGKTVTLRELAYEQMKALAPIARELGEEEDLQKLESMLNEGLPYERIIGIYEDTNSLYEVVKNAADDVYPMHQLPFNQQRNFDSRFLQNSIFNNYP